jgi:hypothetical protein
VEHKLELDLAALTSPGAEAEASEQGSRGPVLPQRNGGEPLELVGAGALDDPFGQSGADAHPLQRVDHFDCHLGHSRPAVGADVATDPGDRPITFVDRRQSLVIEVIDVSEVGELARREFRLLAQEAPTPGLGAKPVE